MSITLEREASCVPLQFTTTTICRPALPFPHPHHQAGGTKHLSVLGAIEEINAVLL